MKRGTVFCMSLLISTILFPIRIYAAGKELILTWEFPATDIPAPEQFLVTYTSTADQGNVLHQFTVPNHGHASCAGVKGLATTQDSICGRPPACLPPGITVFWIQAEVGGALSAKSNLANCLVLPGCQYECTDLVIPPEIQKMVDNPPADLAALQAVLQQIPQVAETVSTVRTFTPPQLHFTPVEGRVPG